MCLTLSSRSREAYKAVTFISASHISKLHVIKPSVWPNHGQQLRREIIFIRRICINFYSCKNKTALYLLWFRNFLCHELRNSNVNLLESVFLLSVCCLHACYSDARAKSIRVKIGGLRGAQVYKCTVRTHPLFMPAIRVKTREWLMRSNEAFDPPPLWAIHLICRRSSKTAPAARLRAPPRAMLSRTIPLALNVHYNI